MAEHKPEGALVRQLLIGLIVILIGGLVGVVILGHGWGQELALIIWSLILVGIAILVPKLTRWIRARWGPEPR